MDKDLKTKFSNIFDLMQNTALSAIALHSFTLGYNNVAKNRDIENPFPKLSWMFYVLPIVYNFSSRVAFSNSNEIYRALIKEPSIILGLQERANKMSCQTFDALNLAFSKKILSYNSSDFTIHTLRPFTSRKIDFNLKVDTAYLDVKGIQNCSFKLGGLFAKKNERNIQQDLNIWF